MPPQVPWRLWDEVRGGDWWLGVCRGQAHTGDAREELCLGGQSWADWEGVCAQWKGGAEGLADG